ncbi:efflux RND transporter permease subunit, partial [Pseudomonas sp. SIMBA_068]|uniref:efflux RND transporter permease subunit n=1 Tax=Pseudomonas sp. SIMBA_068 TaxID=3085808 RepID=UPI003978F9AB
VGVINTDGTMTQEDISDYVAANMKDAISRTSGVGDVQLFGSQYAMRIWMDPHKLNNYNLTPVDVISALNTQNTQVAAGQLGGTPPVPGQQL